MAALNGILCSFVGLLLAVTMRFAVNVNLVPAYNVLAILALIALIRKVNVLWVVFALCVPESYNRQQVLLNKIVLHIVFGAIWGTFYNFDRPHGAFNGKTPYQALRNML